MGRGRGADAIFEAFEEINSRNGQVAGTALEMIFRSLFDCSMGDPEAPGFLPQSDDYSIAADALVAKGLAEKNEEGWKLTKAGFQLMSQYLAADFFG
jgi:hypothetical protein